MKSSLSARTIKGSAGFVLELHNIIFAFIIQSNEFHYSLIIHTKILIYY